MGRDDQIKDFNNYDFDGNAEFQSWLAGVETVGSRDTNKLKAKWYKKNIDVNFQIDWATQQGAARQPATSSTPSGNASSYRSQPSPTPPPTQPATGSNWGSNAGSGSSSGGTRGPNSTQLYLAVYHLALVVLPALHLVFLVVPLLPGLSRLPLVSTLSQRAYAFLLQLLVVGQGFKLYLKHGKPPIWPFSWPGLQQYLAGIAPTSDFTLFLIGATFNRQLPISLVVVPVAITALYEVMQFAAGRFANTGLWAAYGSKLHQLLLQKQRDSQLACAYCEVWVGVSLVLALLGRQRNFMLAFGYWNLLKMRYHVGDTAAMHRMVWYAIGQKTAGVRANFPILNRVANAASSWFMNVR